MTRSRWLGLLGVVLLGWLPSACDRPEADESGLTDSGLLEPMPAAPTGAPETEVPSSMALDAAPLEPSDPNAPPPPPPGAFLAQLSPDQVAQLTSLGVEVVVPGVVPPSFQVADLRISQGDMGISYLIVYQNAENQCFAVEYADGGTSPPPATENRRPINPPLFTKDGDTSAYGLNYGKFADPDWQARFPEPNLYTDWLAGSSGYYRISGAADIKALFPGFDACRDVSPQMAVDLAESFTLVTAPTSDMF
ncbi:hypothetical protein [Leptolyngbya sp. BL0902]|uniref:hypothetical protein n=1 Tax=Leptolyngbya sp. BL0902 TaxID=1115757 RepID=UPI0018E7C8D8|nr:hypothetical protein [Leptolyngbya sp. BL0902]